MRLCCFEICVWVWRCRMVVWLRVCVFHLFYPFSYSVCVCVYNCRCAMCAMLCVCVWQWQCVVLSAYQQVQWHWFRFSFIIVKIVNKRKMGQFSKQISVSVCLSQHSLSLIASEWQIVLWKKDRDRDLLRTLTHRAFVYIYWKSKPMSIIVIIQHKSYTCRRNENQLN